MTVEDAVLVDDPEVAAGRVDAHLRLLRAHARPAVAENAVGAVQVAHPGRRLLAQEHDGQLVAGRVSREPVRARQLMTRLAGRVDVHAVGPVDVALHQGCPQRRALGKQQQLPARLVEHELRVMARVGA